VGIETWRYIPLLQAPGDVQMAVDHWLFEQCVQGRHPPTLRFYQWSPPAISLGYHQHPWPDHWRSLHWQGIPIPLVRRRSGGRAVLHQGDLSYAVITATPQHLMTGSQSTRPSRRQAYDTLCQFLMAGWASLGIPLTYGGDHRSYRGEVDCFRLATGADLVWPDGTKFIGSAQGWRQETVLQHGSMRLTPAVDLFCQVFGPTQVDALQTFSTVSLPTVDAIVAALMQAAIALWPITLTPAPLTEAEWEAIAPYRAQTQVEG
jgi:lipoate---protein ligase